ncbi:MAG TPA: ROK family protein [Polyangiaceae bacterium]|jgi:polyphosphate glucokinase|nr:ROK family protein [Polyangiaceae bacterium]
MPPEPAITNSTSGTSSSSEALPSPNAHTLAIDIGGTGIKMIVLDATATPLNERARTLTPHPATPDAMLGVIKTMLAAQPAFDRVAVGFPGIVKRGVAINAPNLADEAWRNFPLQERIEQIAGRPVRVMNDADLQGFGVIAGKGVELALTLGTGVGSGLYVDGRLVPNLELGHHPWKKEQSYEDRLRDSELQEIGKKHWSKRVFEMIEQLEPIFNYDVLYLGGGNAEHIKGDLPANVKLFTNVQGMAGGVRIWAVGVV